jgi:hypothetical protein
MSSTFGGFVDAAKIEPPRSAGTSRPAAKNAASKKESVSAIVVKATKHTEESPPETVGAKLVPRHAFGYGWQPTDDIVSFQAASRDRGEVSDRVIFRIGKMLTIMDPDGVGALKFIASRQKQVTKVLHLSVSKNNKYISACESVRTEREDKGHAQVSVYSLNMTTVARLKTLTKQSTGEFIQSCFLAETKYLATLIEAEDTQIIIWLWEKEKQYKTIALPGKVISALSLLKNHLN